MFLDTRQHTLLETLPARSFATLMELYESNYILLRRLAPELHDMHGDHVSTVSGTVDLHLGVLEQAPYTTSASLTHFFPNADAQGAQPGLLVRVYHDARVAEVMPETPVEQFDLWAGQKPEPKSLEWRWELNRFMNRWLRYCLGEGHEFVADYAHRETG